MIWRDGTLLAGCTALSVIVGSLWLTSVPFQRGPDEAAHYQVAAFIRHQGRLPVFSPHDLWLINTSSGPVETYAAYPPLAYIVGAAAMLPVQEYSYLAARCISLLSYVLSAVVTFLLARAITPRSRLVPVLATLTVTLLPQFAFTGAYFNNDALAVCESALLYLFLWKVATAHRSARMWLAVGATIGALFITKYTFYAAGGIGLLIALLILARRGDGWLRGLALAVGVAAVSGWWFARNLVLYGELLPSQVIAAAKAAVGGNALFVPSKHGISVWTLSTATDFWEISLQSFVGVFGFLTVFLEPWHYAAAAVAAALGLAGLCLRLLRAAEPGERLAALAAGVVAAGTVLSVMVVSTYGESSPQGRYFFALLVPVAVGLALGWSALGRCHWLLRCVPLAAGAGVVYLNLASLLGYLVPAEFGLPTPTAVVQIDRPDVPQRGSVEVLGWSYTQGNGSWRPFAFDVLTRYRRPVEEVVVYLGGPPGRGRYVGRANVGLPRPDVRDAYGGNPNLERVGYRLLLPPDFVTPGRHQLYTCVRAGAGEPSCASKTFEVIQGRQLGDRFAPPQA